MKPFLILLFSSLLSISLFAQNPIWIGGVSQILPLDEGLPTPYYTFDGGVNYPNTPWDGYDGQKAQYANNIQVAANENDIEFFIVDSYVYDGAGNIIGQLVGNGIAATGASEIMVVPFPNQCKKYYIFSTTIQEMQKRPYVFVLDMNLPNPYYLISLDGEAPENCAHYGSLVPYSEDVDWDPQGFYEGESIWSVVNEYHEGSINNIVTVDGEKVEIPYFDNSDYPKLANINFAATPPSTEISNLSVSVNGEDIDTQGASLGFISETNGIYVFILSSQGIFPINYIAWGPCAWSQGNLRSEMEVVALPDQPGNFRIACPFSAGVGADSQEQGNVGGPNLGQIEFEEEIVNVKEIIYTATLSTDGSVESFVKFPLYTGSDDGVSSSHTSGLEFGPRGKYLYVTHTVNDIQEYAFEYIDFDAADPQMLPVPSGQTLQNGGIDLQFSHIERYIDGKLRLAHSGGLYQMSAINPEGAITQTPNETFEYEPNFEGYEAETSPVHKLFVLQDQIDNMDYMGVYTQNEACCLENSLYSRDVYEFESSGSYNASNDPINGLDQSPITIQRELRVPAGIAITLNDVEIHFAPGARLVIENGDPASNLLGGRLILKNSILTADTRCVSDAQWLGVEVWGNQNEPQTNTQVHSQGKLIMHGTTIEHAKIGVLVSKRADSYDTEGGECIEALPTIEEEVFDNNRNGGIVLAARGSKFTNNTRGVLILPYVSPNGVNNLCRFTKTTFAWDDNIRGKNYIHIQMNQVEGVYVKGCELFNNISLDLEGYQYGAGIFSNGSKFFAIPNCNVIGELGAPCPDETRNTFRDLNFGIITLNWNDTRSFVCNKNNFINNRYGVYVLGTKHEIISNNRFDILELLDDEQSAGLVMYSSHGYTVENNSFSGLENTEVNAVNPSTYGIVVSNSGEEYNEIYRNEFQNLKIGGQTQYNNGQTVGVENTSTSGLKWLCNTFNKPIREAQLTLVNGTMNLFQGNAITAAQNVAGLIQCAARNRFTDPEDGEDIEDHDLKLMNNAQSFQYNYLPWTDMVPNSFTESFNMMVDINEISTVIDGFQMLEEDYPFENVCPSKLRTEKLIRLKDAVAEIDGQINDLDELLDEENYSNLLGLISNPLIGNSTVKSALEQKSPYLTDEVLTAYLNSETFNEYKKDILILNSPLTESMMNLVYSSELPHNIQNQIVNVQEGINPRTRLKYQKIDWQSLSAYKQNKVVQHYLFPNGLIDEIDEDDMVDLSSNEGLMQEIIEVDRSLELKTYLETRPENLPNMKKRMDIEIKLGDLNEISTLRSELETMNATSDYLEVIDIQTELSTYNSAQEAISGQNEMQQQLSSISTGSNDIEAVSRASRLLQLVYGVGSIPDFLTDNGVTSMQEINPTEDENEALVEELSISMYPNPTKDILNFELANKQIGEMEIQIIHISGKVMMTQAFRNSNVSKIYVGDFKKGLYLVKVKVDGVNLKVQKLEIL